MKYFSAITLILLIAISASFGAKVISYTGFSADSQEEANNAAIAGVAKQISTQVSTSQKLSKKEVSKGSKSSFNKNFYVSNQLESNILLKGIQVSPKPKQGKNFVAFASVDLDQLSSELRFKIKQIQTEVKQTEKEIATMLQQKHYADAFEKLTSLRMLLLKHPPLLESLAEFYPLDESFYLSSQDEELEQTLIEGLKKVSIAIKDPKKYEITTPTLPTFVVYASDNEGPIPNFPIYVMQNNRTLGERYTKEAGEVSFSLKNVNFDQGPFVIQIAPNFPPAILKKTGLDKNLEITYKTKKTQCSYLLSCQESINVCNLIEHRLADYSFFNKSSNKKNTIQAKVISEVQKAMKAGRNNIISYSVSLQLKGPQINYLKKDKIIAKTEYEAVIKFLEKVDMNGFSTQAQFLCEE